LSVYREIAEEGVGEDRRYFGVWASELPPGLVDLARRYGPAADYIDQFRARMMAELATSEDPATKGAKLHDFDHLVLLVELNRAQGSSVLNLAALDVAQGANPAGWRAQVLGGLLFDELFEARQFSRIVLYKHAYLARLELSASGGAHWRSPAGATIDERVDFPSRLYVALLREADADTARVARRIFEMFPEADAKHGLAKLARQAGFPNEADRILSKGP
jgi:hypothetical protein